MWKSVLITLLIIILVFHHLLNLSRELWISSILSHQFMKVFHRFSRKKDINFVTLHRKQQLWITPLTC